MEAFSRISKFLIPLNLHHLPSRLPHEPQHLLDPWPIEDKHLVALGRRKFHTISEENKRKMSINDFLKDLPCHNQENFTLFNAETGRRSNTRASVYLPTDDDFPSEQLIVTEKRNILLRHLHLQVRKISF